MKSNELRIGNLVKQGTVTRIQEASARVLSGNAKYSFIHYEFLEPIPLTEEWLIKLGFEVHSRYSFHNFIYNGFGVSMWMQDRPQARFEEKGVCYWGEYYTAIKYVHNLMNLYHAITGQELTIKV